MSSPRALRRLRLLAVAQVVLILASVGAPLTTIAADGDGTVTVTPTSVSAGSTGNVLTFVHTVGADWAGGNSVRLRITVPGGGWSAPTTGAGAGQVAISAETCPGSISLSASGSNIDVSGNNANCNSGDTVTITYSATAGTTTGANTFAASTRTAGAGGSLQPIASSPVVTVNPVVKVDTTTAITSDTPDPSIVGSAFAVGVSVTRASGSSTITGTVTVSDGTDSCTDTTPTGGAAATVTYSCSITSSTSGPKTLTATYGGDANFNGSSGTASHTVNGADGTGTVAVHWDGVGDYSYTDPTITPGMSLELIDFNFTATANMPAGSQVTIVVPAGWTPPTIANSPGVVAINPTTPGLTTPTCTLPTAGTPQTSISGSGPWTITIDVTCAAGATFRLRWGNTLANVITAASAGTYVFTTKSKVAGGTLTDIAVQPTLTVVKLNQAPLVLTGTSSPAAYGSTQALGTTGGSGTGAVTYTSTTPTVCTVSGSTLSIVSGTGTCSVYATKAADANYNAQTSATVNITAAKINQAPLVLTGTSSPAAYGSTQALGTTGGSGTGAVTYSTGASTACSVAGNVLTITASTGTCSVTATKAADANYNVQTSSPVAITVAKAVLTVTPDPQAVTFGDPVPAYTFSVTGFAPGENAGTAAGYVAPTCTSAYTTSTPVASSPLTITCSGGSATNYTFDTTATALLTIAKADQAPLVLTGTSSPAAYGSTQTLGTTGGSGTGAVTYSTGASTACSVAGNVLTITASTGTCSVTATKAADANYNVQTSSPVAITVAKAVLTVTPDPQAVTFGDPVPAYTFSVTGFAPGENAGTAAGYVAPTCTSAYTTSTPVASSPLTITCSGGSATNYTFDTTATALLTIAKADQAPLVLTGTSSPAAYGSTQTLGTTGGSGTGAVTYTSTTPTVCTVSGNTLSIVSGTGTCSVYATKAADANYNAQTSATVNLTAAKAASTTVVSCPAGPFTYTGAAQTPCTATVTGPGGLSASLPVSYADNTDAGTATASASYAGDANHDPSSDSTTFTIAKAASTTVVSCPAGPFTYTGAAQTPCTATVTGPGGLSQTLPVSYADNTDAGTATASASYAGDANHDPSSDSTTFTIGQAAPVCAISGTTVTYDGLPHGATGLCLGVNGETLAGLDRGASFTDVPGGTADWTFTDTTGNYTDDAGSVDIEIAPAAPVCSISGTTITYDGLPHGATGLCLGVNGETLAGLDRGASFTDVPGGTADWTFTDTTGNYTDDAGSVDIGIDPAVLTVTPDPQAVTFGDPVPAYTFSVTGFAPGENAGTAAGYVAPTCTSAYTTSTPVASSPLTITCSGGSATNYTFDTTATALLTIGKAASTTVVSCPAGPFTYTGAAQTPCTATVTGPGGLSQTLPVSYADNTDAGTATASASYAGDANHDPSSDSTTFTIGQAAPVCAISGTTVTYDGLPHGATGLCLGVNGETLAGLDRGASFTDVPGGTADWTLSNPNYTSASGSVDITITQAAQTIDWPPLPDVTYGVPSFELNATTGFGLPITYTSLTPSVCTVSGSTVTLVGVGTCRIVASQPGDGNVLAAQSVMRVFQVAAADDDTPETSTLGRLADLVTGSPLQRSMLLGLIAVGVLALVILLLGFRARRREPRVAGKR